MNECSIEYVSGEDSHDSSWGKFWVFGLKGDRKRGGTPKADKLTTYHRFICSVPAGTVFTIFEEDGEFAAPDTYNFRICQASQEVNVIRSAFDPERYCSGNFEIICDGAGKTKGRKLFDWWKSFVGDEDTRTNEEKLAFAAHCYAHLNKKGIKTLPPFEMKSTIDEEPTSQLNPKNSTAELSNPSKHWINIDLIKLDAGTQSRKETNQATIDDYAEQMAENRWQWEREPLPLLFFDGIDHYPGDGHHRIIAASQTREEIFAEVRSGTLRDAIFYSTQANRFHGLQRTRADKRNQVELLLKDSEWQTMSDRAIADHCGVSAPFVGNIRRELIESGTVSNFSERTDKKGRTIATGNIGKRGVKRNESPEQDDSDRETEESQQLPNTGKKTKLHPDSPITAFEQEVIKQCCKIWKPRSVVEFILKYADENDIDEILELVGNEVKGLQQ